MNAAPNVKPVLFHSPDDIPYGVFSSFAQTPIWIAGHRYATVEHWYQAMRAVGDEHEWIRAAPTPEEATVRAQSVEARRYWIEEKVTIMYRGMLAKFRQHAQIGDLLLATTNASIHELCDDEFWGGKGQDWLGRILMHVRAQLRDPGSDGPLTHLLQGRLLNYETALATRHTRSNGLAWFVHLIRYRESQQPIETLRRIVEEGILRTNRLFNGHHAVCFSASPLHHLEQRVFGTEARMRRAGAAHVYSPFGLAVTYEFGRELGLRPVLPVPTESTSELPPYLRYLAQPFSSRDLLDYTHEDEWRTPHDLPITEGRFALAIPTTHGLSLKSICGLSTEEALRTLDSHATIDTNDAG